MWTLEVRSENIACMDSRQRRSVRREIKRVGTPVIGKTSEKEPKGTATGKTVPFYESAPFWGFVSLAAAILLTIIASRMKDLSWLFVPAWVCTIPPTAILCKSIPRRGIRGLCLIGLPIVAALAFYWLNGATEPKNGGTSGGTPTASNELPTPGFQDDTDTVDVTFGLNNTGGVHIAMLKRMPGRSVYPINYDGYTPVKLEYWNGKVSYSVKFWSPTQNSVVEVKDGKLVVRNPDLDRNYSSRALEVVTKGGHPILQIVWLTPGHMRLNGLFPLPDGNLLCMSNDNPKTVGPADALVDCAITPIFKYPSWKYQGVLATK